ncbi:MAG: hypothetical protein ACYSTF_05725 [Planctomycetota bacterium]
MQKLAFFLAWLVLVISSQAEVFIVVDDGPTDFNNIQAAMNAGRTSVRHIEINDSLRMDSDETG